ncbi:hypothetical protein [Cylindrospermopsis raciborskii]|uniref:hypothetical protein n=1 Tax=Cylindrospermopsis raciborskii TaxID=77022 RepID=UPI001454CDB4|nr:hypothetical protein [Cylindrospermopsis raciborskii]NLQ05293.1 hypothetical protein [Cylindrospermopsis raciborskii MVCC19]
MFSLKAPLFKGGWGGSNAIKHSHRKNTLLLRDFLENGKKGDRTWGFIFSREWVGDRGDLAWRVLCKRFLLIFLKGNFEGG